MESSVRAAGGNLNPYSVNPYPVALKYFVYLSYPSHLIINHFACRTKNGQVRIAPDPPARLAGGATRRPIYRIAYQTLVATTKNLDHKFKLT